jgi:hypothetical protein
VGAARGVTVNHATPKPCTADGKLLQPYYADAAFSIPTIGRAAPPVRGPYGWDLIMLTDILPARDIGRDELLAEMFPDLRRRWFEMWSVQIGKALGVQVEVDEPLLQALADQEVPVALAPPAAAGPP